MYENTPRFTELDEIELWEMARKALRSRAAHT